MIQSEAVRDPDPLVERVFAEASKYYESEAVMSFHHWGHPQEILQNVIELLDRCREAGVVANETVVKCAALLHDALGHIDFKLLGFESAEALAGTLTENLMLRLGFDQIVSSSTGQAVRATNRLVALESVEDKIVRAADLKGLAAPYQTFRSNTEKLHYESELRSGQKVAFEDYVVGQMKYLRAYLYPMIELTREARDDQGRSNFHAAAMRNILRLIEDSEGKTGKSVRITLQEVSDERDVDLPRSVAGEEQCLILISEDEELRRRLALNPMLFAETRYGFVLPGNLRSIPLPLESVDQVIAPKVETEDILSEMARVVRSKH